MPMQISGFGELTARLGTAEAELTPALEAAALEAAHIFEEQAKANADFSTKIPGQISSAPKDIGGLPGAQVKVAEGVYPHVREAAVLEGDGYGGTFRHPVYDHGGWAPQDHQPFLQPAFDERRAEATEVIDAAARRVITGG